MVKECRQEFDLRVRFITLLNAFAHVWARAISRLSWKGLQALPCLSSPLLNLSVDLIVYNYRVQIWLSWLVVSCQFYWKVSGSVAEIDLKQSKWKSVLWITQVLLLPTILLIMIQVIHSYETNGLSVFKSIKSHGFLIKMSRHTEL